MLSRFYWQSAVWTAIGLLGGLYYREITRSHDVLDRSTQLGLVHTHTLVLGTLAGLVFLLIERAWTISAYKSGRAFFWTWNIGVAITVTMLAVKGTMQVLDVAAATSPAIAGVSGLGHMTLTAAFILFFVALNKALADAAPTT